MRKLLRYLFNYRVRALIKKEFNQIRRDRRLAISLILPAWASRLVRLTKFVRLPVAHPRAIPDATRTVSRLHRD